MSDLSLAILINAVDNASSVLGGVGSAVGMVAAAVIQVGAQTTQMAADYQQSMNMVSALTGSTQQQMAQYDEQLKSLAVDAGVAPTELSKGLYNVISAGYAGSDAMKVLALSTEDSKIGMTDATTTSLALTKVLNAFQVPASQFNTVNGMMMTTVRLGAMTMGEYAGTIAKTSSFAVQYHDSMAEMNASLATLTMGTKNATIAGTDYDNLLKVLNGNTDSVAKSAHALNPAFNANKFAAMDLTNKVDYLNKMVVQHGHNITDVIGRQQNAAQAFTVLTTHMDKQRQNLKALSDQQAMAKITAQQWATTQAGFNQQLSRANAAWDVMMITLGNKLLPILGQLLGWITPLIVGFTNWMQAGQQANGVMSQIGSLLSSLFLPVWQQLVTLFQTQLVPLWFQLQTAIAPIMPQLQQVAMIIGGVLYASFVLGIAIIRGFIGALSGLLTGVVLAVQGIVQMFQGGFQVVQGLIQFFVDLFTGQWNKLGTDLGSIAGGIVKMFQGMWTAIAGIFVSAVNGLIGLVNGFLAGIISGINAVLTATGHAAIGLPHISMLSAPAVANGNYSNMFVATASKAQGVTPKTQAQSNTWMSGVTQQLAALTKLQSSNSIISQANQTTGNNSLNALNNSTVPSAANTVAAASKGGHAKTAAQIAKAADTANAQRLRLAADQQKALKNSSSSAVKDLIAKSNAAEAKGDTATANFYAQQAASLASQQHATTQRAARQAQAAAHHQAVLAAQAARKAAATKRHQDVLAAHEAAKKAKAAAQAAKDAKAAARTKNVVDAIQQAANQVSGVTNPQATAVIAATAAGIILPDYIAGTAYTAYNAPASSPATTGNTTINVTVASSGTDPKTHGKKIADEVNKHLAKHLRQQSIAPRYTHGGSHH